MKIVQLAPHDPIPDPGHHALVLRRLGEDDPTAIVTEIIFYDRNGGDIVAHRPNGEAMSLKEAVRFATKEAGHHGATTIYVLDRTKGEREQEVIRAHGAHNFPAHMLEDFDVEDGEQGTDIRDRKTDSGYLR